MNYILCEYTNKNDYDAGNKARSDVVSILKRVGYKHIPLFESGKNKLLVMCQLVSSSLFMLFKANKGEDVFIQYPYYPNIVNKLFFRILRIGKVLKKYSLTVIIHDLHSLRRRYHSEQEQKKYVAKEIKILGVFDRLICHNEIMSNCIKSAGFDHELIVLGPFDYLYEGPPIEIVNNERSIIIIAGNLKKEKSGYIYKLKGSKTISYNLYGVGYEGDTSDYISYKGMFSPDDIIYHLEGNYGLVWDGDSVVTCSGGFGSYLRYNNPHKFSLYIAAGLPLIVWSESALASYVISCEIGITIDSLEKLEYFISAVKPEEYRLMVENVKNVRKRIINGDNLITALGILS